MTRILSILILLGLITACGPTIPGSELVIVPSSCDLVSGAEFPFSLKGTISSDAKVTWEATKGSISPSEGIAVIYQAPDEPGVVSITAIISTKDIKTSTSITCNISVPTIMQPITEDVEEEVIPQITDVIETPTSAPAETGTPEPTPMLDTIAITEVMANPCASESRNEYVELYNYGDTEIDVQGWWIAISGGRLGSPDQIVPFAKRFPYLYMGNNILTDTSIIPPGKYAVILSPNYANEGEGSEMVYKFPEGTIILTIAEGDRVGDDNNGIYAERTPPDTLVLYIGTNSIIDKVISTYGTPNYGSTPKSIQDDGADNIPFTAGDCVAVERKDPSQPDAGYNWQRIENGSPGSGP